MSILSDLPIAIDNFQTRRSGWLYFLTHFHVDHLTGLDARFDCGFIYCSERTRSLVRFRWPALSSRLVSLSLNEARILQVPNSKDTVTVTAFEANHCAGAFMFFFETRLGRILHTGDFRFEKDMPLPRDVDLLLMDMTFMHPSCAFPTKQSALQQLFALIRGQSKSLQLQPERGTYGSRRCVPLTVRLASSTPDEILAAIHAEFQAQVFVEDEKRFRQIKMEHGPAGLAVCSKLCTDSAPPYRFVLSAHDNNSSNNSNTKSASEISVKCSAMWFVLSKNPTNAPVRDSTSGVWHVCWAQHSDWRESQEFIRLVGANHVRTLQAPRLTT